MVNQRSINEINKKASFSKELIKPLYESYNSVKIIEIIKYLFRINKQINFPQDLIKKEKRAKKIIVFLIDGFGWRFIEKFKKHPFILWINKIGIISKITSQFPSTTSAHISLFHTGLPVGETGIYEWNYYEPKVDAVISPLLFSFAGDKNRDTLKKTKITSRQIFPKNTFYQLLKKNNIKSFIFQHQEYASSTYSKHIFRGGLVYPYKTLTEAITNLFGVIKKENNPSYYFLYFDKIDSLCHKYGPSSPQAENEILTFLSIMKNAFFPLFKKNKNELTFMMTADHGQIDVNPQNCFYINHEIPLIKKFLKKNQKGDYLVPAGSPRDMFLYLKEEYLQKGKTFLEKKLREKAYIFYTKDLIKMGFFGKKISKKFISRLGNLTIIPKKNQTIWWYKKNKFEMKFLGSHGGLSKEEMEIELIFV